MIKLQCPDCGKRVKVLERAAGKKRKCPRCGMLLRVPRVVKRAEPKPQAKPEPRSEPKPQAKPEPRSEVVNKPVRVNVNQSQMSHSLGIASLVIGILAFFVCWTPFVGVFFAGIGFLLGAAGVVTAIVRKGSGVGYSIAGSAVSLVALAIGGVVTAGTSAVVLGLYEVAVGSSTKAIQAERADKVEQNTENPDTPENVIPVEENGVDKSVPPAAKNDPLWKDASAPPNNFPGQIESVSPDKSDARSDSETQWIGEVVGVHDGDSLTVLRNSETQVKIRLVAIDAPELEQEFGPAAKKQLSKLVFGKHVRIYSKGLDRYGRTLGRVVAGNRDVNRSMISTGSAWHYRQYSDSESLQNAEDRAKAKKLGLWRLGNPKPPWEFRKVVRQQTAEPVNAA